MQISAYLVPDELFNILQITLWEDVAVLAVLRVFGKDQRFKLLVLYFSRTGQ